MKILGYWLIGIGILYLLFAFNMDVSVSTSSTYVPGYGSVGGGDVANLDLMARRQNHVIVAALITLVGTLMAIFGRDGSETAVTGNPANIGAAKADYSDERDLASDHYRLWLAEYYTIERNDVFDRFVVGQQTFKSLDEALAHVHSIEMQKIAYEAAENERIEAEVAANKEAVRLAQEQADAAFREALPKIIVGALIAIALIVAAYLFFKETPEERTARLAREVAERIELSKEIEKKFGIFLPKDVSEVTVTDNAATYDFLCNDEKDGTLLEFRTGLTEDEVQKLFAEKLGKGESKYGLLPDNYDWTWQKGKFHYELSMLGEGPPPTGVKLCMTE